MSGTMSGIYLLPYHLGPWERYPLTKRGGSGYGVQSRVQVDRSKKLMYLFWVVLTYVIFRI